MPFFYYTEMFIDKKRIIYLSVILSTGLIIYCNALLAGFLSLDDASLVHLLQSSEMPYRQIFFSGGSYFRPLVTISFLFNYHLFGANPAAFHLTNVLLHLLNGLLIYYLIVELIREDDRKDVYAFLASLLFVVHPLNTEAVMWVSARPDLLATFFSLLSLILITKYQEKIRPIQLVMLFFVYLFSLFSKESAIVFAGIVPLYLWSREKNKPSFDTIPISAAEKNAINRKTLVIILTLITAVLVYFILRTGQLSAVDAGVSTVISSAAVKPDSVTPVQVIAGYGLYLRKLIYPFPLNFAIVSINYAADALIILPALFLAGLLFYRNAKVRLPLLIVFVGVIPPILAFIGRIPWTPFAERYLYISMAGFSILAAVLILDYLHRVPFVFKVALLLLLAIPTIYRVFLWADPIAFWQDAVIKSPGFPRTHVAYAAVLMDEKRYDEAETHLRKAASAGFNQDYLWKHIATIYFMRKDYANYEKMMLRAAEVSPTPTELYLQLINNLGIIDRRTGDNRSGQEKAIRYYLMAHQRDPIYIEGLYNAGKLYWIRGDMRNASHYLSSFLDQKQDSMFKPFARKILIKIKSREMK